MGEGRELRELRESRELRGVEIVEFGFYQPSTLITQRPVGP
jgi:hypothetical protein